jgi:hypothetical protein
MSVPKTVVEKTAKAAEVAVPWLERAFGQTFKLARTAWMRPSPKKGSLAAKWQNIGRNAAGPVALATGAVALGYGAMVVTDTVSGTKKALAATGDMFEATGENLNTYALYSLIAATGLAALIIITRRR